MPILLKVSGSWKTVAAPSVRVGGAWKAVAKVFVRVAGAWKETFAAIPPLSAPLDTYTATASAPGNGPLNTPRVTVSPTGGVAPYTIHWEYVNGDVTLSPNDSNIGNPWFIGSGTAPQTKTGQWHCRVTDNVGTTVFSGNVSLQFDFL